MSKLDELIKDLCPDGVEYRSIGEVCVFQRGKSITQKDVTDGCVPVIAGGQKPAYYHNIFNRAGETIVISSSGAYAGFVSYWDIPIFLSDSFSVNPDKSHLTLKYVFYYLKSIQEKIHDTKKGGGVPHVHGSSIAHFQIPAPPLPVQKEIVQILDKFTLLEAELKAELKARKKQYEYYRDELLTFDGEEEHNCINSQTGNKVQWLTLGDIGKISMCKRIFKEQTSAEGEIPFYKIGTFGKVADSYIPRKIFEEYKEKYSYPKKGDVLISASGTIGRTVIFDGKPSYFQDSNIIWIANNEKAILNKYLYYVYTVVKWGASKGGAISRIYNENVKKIPIPVPPLAEQERIVAILDRFDALVNDISKGLPAEIEARRKQYEYYRDKLFTFKEKIS